MDQQRSGPFDIWVDIAKIRIARASGGYAGAFDYEINVLAGEVPPGVQIEALGVHTLAPVEFTFHGERCVRARSRREGYVARHSVTFDPVRVTSGALRRFVLHGVRQFTREFVQSIRDENSSYRFAAHSLIEIRTSIGLFAMTVPFSVVYVAQPET